MTVSGSSSHRRPIWHPEVADAAGLSIEFAGPGSSGEQLRSGGSQEGSRESSAARRDAPRATSRCISPRFWAAPVTTGHSCTIQRKSARIRRMPHGPVKKLPHYTVTRTVAASAVFPGRQRGDSFLLLSITTIGTKLKLTRQQKAGLVEFLKSL